jgi:hypothetical protein
LISSDEQKILSIFRRLPPESRDVFLLVGQGLFLKNQQTILKKTLGESTSVASPEPAPDHTGKRRA